MKRTVCEGCGSSEFRDENGYRICLYCGSRYRLENTTEIVLDDDIRRLLQKCEDEPWNAVKYANLILDIDPTNEQAKKIVWKGRV